MSPKQMAEVFPFLDRWLRLRHDVCQLPGLAVTVRKKGKLLFSKSYGVADLESGTLLEPSHLFRVASHSKTFTAVAIMQLAESGKLRIDDAIVDYLPWLKEHRDKRIGEITIRQVLCHNSGLLRDSTDAAFWSLEKPFLDAAQLKATTLESDLIFTPNTQMKYSNLGYSLLGALIESVSGKPYNRYVKANIIDVLGLQNTTPEIEESIESNLVNGYTRRYQSSKRTRIEHANTRAMSAATGFCSTAEDLSKFYSALLVGTGLLLSDQSKREIQRVQCKVPNSDAREEYGLGVIIEYSKERKRFGHGGGFPGHKSYTLCDQSEDLVIVALTNAIEIAPEDIARGVISIFDYFDQSFKQPSDKAKLSHFQGILMNMWGEKDIVVIGDKVVSIGPNKWMPFSYVEELEYVDQNTLKIVKADGFGSEGQPVHFQFDDSGAIASVIYGGFRMWPEAIYLQKLKDKDSIGLREHQSASR